MMSAQGTAEALAECARVADVTHATQQAAAMSVIPTTRPSIS